MKEEKCSECHGEGELKIPVIPPYYMVYPPKDVSHAKVEFRRIPCPICRGTGRRPIRSAPRMADTLKGAAALGSLHIHPHINMQDIQDILAQLFGNQVPITATFAAAMRPGVSPVDPKIPDEESRFEKDWRSEMPRTWKGWSQTDIRKSFAKVWIDESKGVLCARFPYNQSAIEEFRLKIPKGKKAWNSEEKLWEFSVETIEVVVEILTKFFDEVVNLTESLPLNQVVTRGDPLLSMLDKDDIKAIHRMLANKYHPDKQGGDAGKMARINQIFNQVKNGG